MRYEGNVFRPPSEARSYILQVTHGCSHNRCSFCAMYRGVRFRARPEAEVLEDIALAREAYGPDVRRVFLADGDALVLSTRRLLTLLEALHASFPNLERVGAYFMPSSLEGKSDADLALLRQRGLGIVYLGLESGDEAVLEQADKGCTAEAMVAAVARVRGAGIRASVIALLGLAGVEGSERHARRTAAVVGRMQPEYLSALTVTPVPGTPFHDAVARGELTLPDAPGMLRELRVLVANAALEGTVFRTNHASNYLPLGGVLSRDRAPLLEAIDGALAGRVALRPEFLRGL